MTASHSARVIADSLSPEGQRLTTLEVTFPRAVLAEFNTHRVFSRNSASSRAIPVAKQLRKVMEEPFVPEAVGKNQAGMQAGALLTPEEQKRFHEQALVQRDRAVLGAFEHLMGREQVEAALGSDQYRLLLADGFGEPALQATTFEPLLRAYEEGLRDPAVKESFLNIHKETVNRYLEPYLWHTVVVTATEWSNFFALRCHPAADPKIRLAAEAMERALAESTPRGVAGGEWHLPFLTEEEQEEAGADGRARGVASPWLFVSAARCARVSYLTHEGVRDTAKDLELAKRLEASGHMSPFEHVATPQGVDSSPDSNFVGWRQLRKYLAHEADYSLR